MCRTLLGKMCPPEDTPTLEDVPIEEDTADPTCDGTWEACCVEGEVTECCCPEGAVCNYGIYEICDDGTCTIGACDVPDAGSKEDVPPPSEDVPTPVEEDVTNPQIRTRWRRCATARGRRAL